MKVSAKTIATLSAKRFGVSVEQMKGADRARNLAWPRMLTMCIMRDWTNLSLPQIGRFFNRDHTTVRHAIDRRHAIVDQDVDLAAQYAEIVFDILYHIEEARAA